MKLLSLLQNVVQQAKSALENINLTGVPQMRQDASADNQAPNTGFDMGQVCWLDLKNWHFPLILRFGAELMQS